MLKVISLLLTSVFLSTSSLAQMPAFSTFCVDRKITKPYICNAGVGYEFLLDNNGTQEKYKVTSVESSDACCAEKVYTH